MDFSWISTSWSSVLMVIISAAVVYLTTIILTRISGLRSFSKMSGFDFAVTVAIGAIIGSTILSEDPPLAQAIAALGILYLFQKVVATFRGSSTIMSGLVDNKPLLLMKGTTVVDDNLKKAKVTSADLRAKLREANITQVRQVKAVVMETTGDISVMHHKDEAHELDNELLLEVRGWE